MRILFIGDVVGKTGCEGLRRKLPQLKKDNNIDLTIVNCENASATNGVMPAQAQHIFDSGADVLTGGNHIFGKKQIFTMLEENPYILRPANYPKGAPGKGVAHIDCGRDIVTVINLQGNVYMDSLQNPFETLDTILKEEPCGNIIFVDFHAEATSEKKALGFYADGRVSALIGTHTHVQTADEVILPGGTGYLTDAGMTGVQYSVLGAKKEIAIDRFITKISTPFELEDGEVIVNGVICDIASNGKCLSIKRIQY